MSIFNRCIAVDRARPVDRQGGQTRGRPGARLARLDRATTGQRLRDARGTGWGGRVIDRLGCVRLEVADLDRSIAFYRDGLRFSLESQAGGTLPRAQLRAGGLQLTLVPAAHRRRSRRGSGVALSVEVSGVDAYYEALVARGLLPSPPVDGEPGRHFSIQDPDGYTWTFVQNLS